MRTIRASADGWQVAAQQISARHFRGTSLAVPQMGRDKSLLMLLFQVAKVRELAERRVAQLNGRIQGLESRMHQLSEENRALANRAPAALAGVNPQVKPLQTSTVASCSS